MIADPWFYVTAVVAVLIVGIAKGGLGGGIAVVGVPLMAMTVSPVQAAAVLLPILMVFGVFLGSIVPGRADALVDTVILGILKAFAPDKHKSEIGRAHVGTPGTGESRMPSSA